MTELEKAQNTGGLRKYKAYDELKQSGIEGLGSIPAHWYVLRAKALELNAGYLAQTGPFGAQLHASDYLDAGEDGVPLILIKHVNNLSISHEVLPRISQETANRLAEYWVKTGDIVFSRVGSVGRIGLVTDDESGWLISGQMLRLRFQNPSLHPPYLLYAISSDAVLAYFDLMSVGTTRDSINTTILREMPLPIPPVAEQRVIAAFLDWETARIDALVAKNERLIELLEEERRALITRAVTTGLDPTVPMKDSGVEWLGEIPLHWRVKRLKFLLTEPLKYGANEAAELDDPDLPRYVRITDIDERDSLKENTFKSLPADVAEDYLLREGDLLFARSGATAGKTFLYRRTWGTCAYAGYLIRARLDTAKVSPEFVRYFTASSSYWQWLSAAFIQATIQNVSADKYASLPIPQPPYPEQRTIANCLDLEAARIDALIAKVRDAIDRLKELRTALISAAVTGKIDVREEVA